MRYDQNLHEAEIKSKYAKEECLIQEKEIVRLNSVQEEQQNRIQQFQHDLLKLQEEVSGLRIPTEKTQLESSTRSLRLFATETFEAERASVL